MGFGETVFGEIGRHLIFKLVKPMTVLSGTVHRLSTNQQISEPVNQPCGHRN